MRADVTVTFSMAKPGLFVGKGALRAGKVVVHDIGIPEDILGGETFDTHVIDGGLVRSWLPRRPADGHKGDFGRVLVVGGSTGYTGAPVLCARGALRSGAGLVSLAVPETIYPIIAAKCDEAMPSPLPAREDGRLSEEALVPLLGALAGKDAALIGPGLGQNPGLDSLVCQVLSTVNFPMVVDADGINALSRHMDVLDARRDCPTILTPHDGEFARLGGDLSSGDRLGAARTFAQAHGCLLVLKGHRTIVALPNGECFEYHGQLRHGQGRLRRRAGWDSPVPAGPGDEPGVGCCMRGMAPRPGRRYGGGGQGGVRYAALRPCGAAALCAAGAGRVRRKQLG